MNYVLGSCYFYAGMNRNSKFKQIPSPTGEIKMDDGSKLRADGEKMKKEFFTSLSAGATAIQFAVG